MRRLAPQRVYAQRLGIAGLVVFIALLVCHAWDHRVPLFAASMSGFVVSLVGILRVPRMLRLALHEARVEFAEYYFLLPLFILHFAPHPGGVLRAIPGATEDGH
jgi:hypothetical protein